MIVIFKMILTFLGFSLCVTALDKISKAKVEKNWSNTLNNTIIILIGLAYMFFITILSK